MASSRGGVWRKPDPKARGDEQEPDTRCGTLGASGHVIAKPSIRHGGGLERRPEWTESIALGGEAFVRGIKERLGIRAKGRKVVRVESRFELREISALYVDVFGEENVDLSGENTFFWRQSFKKSVS